jgi:hypothetical protein
MKFTMKKFHLVSKYANYLTWDEKQNAPSFKLNLIIFTKTIILRISKIF